MKKKVLLIICILGMAFVTLNLNAQNGEPILLQATIYDPTNPNGGFHKTPIQEPSVSLEDHILYFETPCDGCTLNIVDENDVVVYTLVIPTGTTSLVLPATLSGEYELQIISGNYLFFGTIDLP